MKENVHFIDCGANIGIAIDWAHAKYNLRSKDQKLVRVDAFEPEVKNYITMLHKCGQQTKSKNSLFNFGALELALR